MYLRFRDPLSDSLINTKGSHASQWEILWRETIPDSDLPFRVTVRIFFREFMNYDPSDDSRGCKLFYEQIKLQ